MQKDVKFQLEDAVEYPEWCDNYPEHKFTVFKCCFLSTKPNSHKLDISNDVLRRDAQSILGNMLVAKIQNGDATTHLPSEIQYGYFPREQEIEFVEEDGVTKAYAYAVVSKHYSKELNNIFEFDNLRNSSVEMTVTTDNDEDEGKVVALDIFGLTVLGKAINGSCPDADIKMVRFSTEDADAYFAKSDSLSNLKQFVEERKQSMAEKKTYKIDKSKEVMSTADWGDYDKAAMRDKIMEAKNRDTLVKSVYLLVEDGWKDVPSEHLKYPVMMLDGDKFIYNRNALSSALAYAKQNDETEVVNKIKAIYKKLDLDDDSERKEEAKMEEIKELAATEVEAESTLEEKKEEMAEPEIEVKAEEPNCDDCDEHDDDVHEEEMSADEMKARIAQLEKDIEDRDNIIMGQNSELETLRQFKKDVEDKEKAICVESVMTECKDYLADDAYKQLRQEGLECKFEEVDAWSNKVKACCFSVAKKVNKKEKSDVFSFAAPIEGKKRTSLWD
nr:MAG TPA: hypothetical protein [Caudoviricetes sp.]